jgi:hypothetical protein
MTSIQSMLMPLLHLLVDNALVTVEENQGPAGNCGLSSMNGRMPLSLIKLKGTHH